MSSQLKLSSLSLQDLQLKRPCVWSSTTFMNWSYPRSTPVTLLLAFSFTASEYCVSGCFFVLVCNAYAPCPSFSQSTHEFSQPSSSLGCAGLAGMCAEGKCARRRINVGFLQKETPAIRIDAQCQKAILGRIISVVHTRLRSVL